MELGTQAVDRMMAALTPTVAAEVDRLVQEVRQDLQQRLDDEFRVRLETAVREAQEAVQLDAAAQREQAVAAAAEKARTEVTAELQRESDRNLDEIAAQLKARFDGDMQTAATQWASERAALDAEVRQWRQLAEAHFQLAGSPSQAEMLARFMGMVEPFAASVAVYIPRNAALTRWQERGSTPFPETISQETVSPEFYFRRIVIRDKTVAAICAVPPVAIEPLDFLATCLEGAVEAFGLKLQAPAVRQA